MCLSPPFICASAYVALIIDKAIIHRLHNENRLNRTYVMTILTFSGGGGGIPRTFLSALLKLKFLT